MKNNKKQKVKVPCFVQAVDKTNGIIILRITDKEEYYTSYEDEKFFEQLYSKMKNKESVKLKFKFKIKKAPKPPKIQNKDV